MGRRAVWVSPLVVIAAATGCGGDGAAPATEEVSTTNPPSTTHVEAPATLSTTTTTTTTTTEPEVSLGCLPRYAEPRQVATIPGEYEASLVTADLTGDGRDDVLVAWQHFGSPDEYEVAVLRNNGRSGLVLATDEVFDGPIPVSQAFSSHRDIVADFNGDGRADVFLHDYGMDAPPFPGHQNLLILSAPDGRLRDATENLPPKIDITHSAAAADVDGDGDVDLHIGNCCGSPIPPYLLLNDGAGVFTEAHGALPTPVTRNSYTVSAFVDVDVDGDQDLVLGGGGRPGSMILLNDGAGVFTESDGALPAGPFPDDLDEIALHIVSMDLGGDGYPDLIVNHTRSGYVGRILQVLVNRGDGTFDDRTDTWFPEGFDDERWFRGVRLLDMDGNGLLDIVARPENYLVPGPHVYLSDGTGFSLVRPDFGLNWLSYEFLDLDGDGGRDLVVASYEERPPEQVFVIRDLGCE
jgi:hypothetical protein